jgi:hypothetical protein
MNRPGRCPLPASQREDGKFLLYRSLRPRRYAHAHTFSDRAGSIGNYEIASFQSSTDHGRLSV